MKKKLKSSMNYLVAFMLIFFGVIGWVLPIVPGLIFVLSGLLIIGIENPKFDLFIETKIAKHSRLLKLFNDVRIRVHSIFK